MILWGVVAVGLWSMITLFCKKSEKRWELWNCINIIGLVVALIFIIKYTMLRGSHKRALCLIPFYSFTFPRTSDRYNTVVANALLFLPVGMSMPYVLASIGRADWIRKHPVSITIISTAIFSFFIELCQYIFRLGLCEIDDVIFNTMGAAMGTISFVVYIYVKNAKKRINDLYS